MAEAPQQRVMLDLDRQHRCGFPEVVFAEGKDVEALCLIISQLIENRLPVLVTRVSAEQAKSLCDAFPQLGYNDRARTLRDSSLVEQQRPAKGRVAVVSAGTSDFPVAEEARETLLWMGIEVSALHDVGVAGPHRLPQHLDRLQGMAAIVVVAGMEGALPSVVGGYVDCPVIAVPTSVGYGANLGGISALLSMLNSCAANVTVVNIDAGFKGGYVAGLIASQKSEVSNE